MSNPPFLCPVCSKDIAQADANSHVNACLQRQERMESGCDPWSFMRSPPSVTPTGKTKNKSSTIKLTNNTPKRQKMESPALSTSSSTPVELEVEIPDSDPVILSSSSNPPSPSLLERLHSMPLAEMMRPKKLDDFVGQQKILGDDSHLRSLLRSNTIPSLILWGPPGCGKTTLARILSEQSRSRGRCRFLQYSATSAGVSDIKSIAESAKNERSLRQTITILFLDEIHRFNKTQQDVLLPHVENGIITLIGATTENPSFSLNSALLSRCRVIVFEKLSVDSIRSLLERTLLKLDVIIQSEYSHHSQTLSFSPSAKIEEAALQMISECCDGDARIALNGIQTALQSALLDSAKNGDEPMVNQSTVESVFQRSHLLYDRKGDQHYDCISALHKSIRGSDQNGAVYWLARMLEAGEDPKFVARRLIRMASEDIGLADPTALPLAVSGAHSVQLVGMPECKVILAQVAIYLARAPKSIEAYKAYGKASECIGNHKGPLPSVPLHLRNAPTALMRNLDYGKGYKYNPAFNGPVDQTYMPQELINVDFYDGN